MLQVRVKFSLTVGSSSSVPWLRWVICSAPLLLPPFHFQPILVNRSSGVHNTTPSFSPLFRIPSYLMPSPSKVPVIVTRQRLNAELHPPIPKAGQFHEVCVCVGKIALQYFALARAYSILCGPAPVGGTLMQKGRHNAMVRELMMHFHSAMDNAVYVKFDSRQRLLVGKQVANSNNPVWDEADGAKSSPLSLVFMREHCSFKTDFSSVLYNSAATSWFNSSGPTDARIDPETKTVFVRLRQKVKEFAELHNVAILPSVPGQWWFSFARDAVDASGVASALTSPSLSVAVKAKRSPPSSLLLGLLSRSPFRAVLWSDSAPFLLYLWLSGCRKVTSRRLAHRRHPLLRHFPDAFMPQPPRAARHRRFPGHGAA